MILHIVGARPNFMKLAPLFHELNEHGIRQKVVHTGQHYDKFMSDVFFNQLKIPKPDFNLGIGSGSQIEQVAKAMIELEKLLAKIDIEFVIVYGDVNSTLAGSLVAAKSGIKLIHIESGLRSFDRTMPEEVNRIITDRLTNIHFTPSKDANENLIDEGIAESGIHLVGNIMIDTLVKSLNNNAFSESLQIPNKYALVTLHRPSNVDDEGMLKLLMATLDEISEQISVIFPVHPRTLKNIEKFDLELSEKITLMKPLGYFEFINYQKNATFVISDSGGIQEETTFLGVPCLTLRSNTERPVTISEGTSTLIGSNMMLLKNKVGEILSNNYKKGQVPVMWDGSTARRIVKIMIEKYL